MNRTRWLLLRMRSVGPRRLALVFQAAALLLAARLALRWIPVRHLLARLERRQSALRASEPVELSAVERVRRAAQLAEVRWAVLAVARHSPIAFVCFPQCLAASVLLLGRGIPSVLHYGVTRAHGRLATHTWLQSGDTMVIGGEVSDEFTLISSF